MPVIEVSDSLSNTPEQLEVAAKTIGRGARRKVFEAIYYHKARVKTAGEIVAKTGLTRVRVLQEVKHLVQKQIIHQTKKRNETAYQTVDFFQVHKRRILALAANQTALEKLPTKRKTFVVVGGPSVTIPSGGAKVKRISIDDVGSFAKVNKCKRSGARMTTLNEDQFKRGVQAIIGEPGTFKDWGGEKSDLYTTRLRLDGRRHAAAFAFKGQGEKAKLVPGRMGKNGDQAQRLFQEDAEVFFVQHWREIDPSVLELVRSLAVAKSVTTGNRIYYGVIDGEDSERLRIAYASKFSANSRRKR